MKDMKNPDFEKKLVLYHRCNPDLDHAQIGHLLLIDNIYKVLPADIKQFRLLFPHLDPKITEVAASGMMFINFAKSKEPTSVIKHRLNQYINTKYNYLGNYRSYDQNMKRFKEHVRIATRIIDNILEIGDFPEIIKESLRISKRVRECTDFYGLLELFNKSKPKRTRFEILRQVGLTVLLSRIQRTYLLEDITSSMKDVKHVFHKGLGLDRKTKRNFYFWVDEKEKLVYTTNRKRAEALYNMTIIKRKRLALETYPMQTFEHSPYKSQFGNDILHMVLRDKVSGEDRKTYTSFVEKMARKNLEFTNQVHDVIGIKLVLSSEEDILNVINDIETFLGGSSTRKKEKNSLNKFGRKKLGKYSSKDYFVWKAVYDIALPHPSIQKLSKMLSLTKKGTKSHRMLLERMAYFKERPQDVVVEVQLQDLKSYLMSIAKGFPAEHSILKRNQVRTNSFYKFFPKEIYEPVLMKLRNKILNS